jgi:hypothetical protein
VRPDLVLTFSDLQADIARDLIQAGVEVHAFNQRSVEHILGMVETVGRLVGAEGKSAWPWLPRWKPSSPTRAPKPQSCPRPPSGLFRGMGRPADIRHPLGFG